MDKVDFCDTILQVSFDTFFSKPVTVYYKRQEDPPGSCSPCGESLVTFMQRVCQTLDAQHSKQFLHAFLEGVTAEMWSGAALVHLVRALSHMPRTPLIGGATLAFLRKIIINTMSTMQVYYFTTRKRSCGKVMFLHPSVCSQRGRVGFPACITGQMTTEGDLPPWGGGLPPGDLPRGRGSASGRGESADDPLSSFSSPMIK